MGAVSCDEHCSEWDSYLGVLRCSVQNARGIAGTGAGRAMDCPNSHPPRTHSSKGPKLMEGTLTVGRRGDLVVLSGTMLGYELTTDEAYELMYELTSYIEAIEEPG